MRRILPLKEQKPNRKLDFYVTFGSESFRILPNPARFSPESCASPPWFLTFCFVARYALRSLPAANQTCGLRVSCGLVEYDGLKSLNPLGAASRRRPRCVPFG